MSAIAGGAETVLVPEFKPDPEALLPFLLKLAYEQGKSHFSNSPGDQTAFVLPVDTYATRLLAQDLKSFV